MMVKVQYNIKMEIDFKEILKMDKNMVKVNLYRRIKITYSKAFIN